MQANFQQHISSQFPFLRQEKILLTISGGIDSVVLTYLSKKIGLNIALAHCNFHLRDKESDADQAFVEALAEEMKIPVFVKHFETVVYSKKHHLSIQLAARKLRYEWFDELSEKHGFQYIFTAHHANDALETFLINTIRGTGLEGLTGIPERNGKIIRPLLPFSRKEITSFAQQNGIAWREDSSNASTKYLRNKIRHHVIPVFEEENPNLLTSFRKTQTHLNEVSGLLAEYRKVLFAEIVREEEDGLYLSISKIQKKENPKAVLYQLLSDYGFTAWNDIWSLLTAETGKRIFSTTHCLLKNREDLSLVLRKAENDLQEIEVNEDDQVDFQGGKLQASTVQNFKKADRQEIYVDKNRLKFPLKLRKWKGKDYFRPFGMQGTKKISHFLKDEKLSVTEKEDVWVLLSEDEIVWVVGQRADDRFKVQSNTTEILKLEWLK